MRKVGFFSASGVLVLALSAPSVANAQFFPGGGGAAMADPIAVAVSSALRASSSFLSLDSVMQSTTLKAISDEAVAIARGASTYVWNGVTGISWATVAKSAGRTTFAGIAVGLAVDGLAKWYFADDEVSEPTSDNEVAYEVPTNSDYVPAMPLPVDPVMNAPVFPANTGELEPRGPGYSCGSRVYAMSWESALSACMALDGWSPSDCYKGDPYHAGNERPSLIIDPVEFRVYCPVGVMGEPFPGAGYEQWNIVQAYTVKYVPSYAEFQSGRDGLPAGVSCPGGYLMVNGVCQEDPLPVPYGRVVETWADASDAIPGSDLTRPVNPTVIAGIVNGLWDHVSSQPGYQGAPYVPGSGVTAGDVSAGISQGWQQPTVNDLVRPIDPTLPGSFEVPGVTVPPGTIDPPEAGEGGNPPPVDLGPDPGIGAPSMEGIPTAQMIIDPLKLLFPSLQNFQVSLPAGECPTASFDVFGETYVVESHCRLIEEQESNIRAAILAAFAVLSLLIVLRA